MPRLLLALLLSLSLAACTRGFIVEQGQQIEPEQLDGLIGLDTNAIRGRLGPPHSRWLIDELIWVYYFKENPAVSTENITAEITFNSNGVAAEVHIYTKEEPVAVAE